MQTSSIEGLDEIIIRNYSDYAQIRWLLNDSIISDYQGENLIPQRNGVYHVDAANFEGCWISTDVSDRIEIKEESLAFSIYTGSEGNIKIENDSKETATIKVYDLNGRIVYSNELQPGTNLFRTERRGILIFRLEGKDSQKTQMVFVY